MLILAYASGSQSNSMLFVCLLLFLCCGNLVKKMILKKNFSEGVNKEHEANGSIMKHQEVFKSFRRCQEASGRIRKAQH